jgi:hypothetical protein
MIELLDAIEASLDPHDPVHTNARDMLTLQRELHKRGVALRAEADRAADAGDFERAMELLEQGAAVLREQTAIAARSRQVSSRLHRVTERVQ